MVMRKEFAVFAGKKIVEKFFTEREAIAAVKDGQHVRWWINNKWLHRETVMTADMEIRLARAINENDRKEVEIYERVLRLLREKKPTQQDIMGMYYPMHWGYRHG